MSPRKANPAPDPAEAGVTAHRALDLLEVREGSDLDAMLLDARLRPLIAARLAPTFALVAPGSAGALLAALRAAGHTPGVRDEGGA